MTEFDVIVRKPSRRLRRKRDREIYAERRAFRFYERVIGKMRELEPKGAG